ncbi:MAG TPA: YsnF/AvaK domain-containing protein [Nitrososphaeraceae archaeon]|nr:YsnF/AvaK domain-containing protein [Nitrososphaeraceae archaeon]
MEYDTKNIPWNEIIKKDARGINDVDLGKIQEVGSDSILTKKGIINTKLFDIPKDLVKNYDGDVVYFKITEEEAMNSYMRKEKEEEYSSIDQSEIMTGDETNDLTTNANSIHTNKNEEIVIPLMGEELVVTKKELQDEITITKEPIRETKTEQVQLMHEEIEIERRPVNNLSNTSNDISTSISEDVHPLESTTEIKIPLKREEAEVTKKPYVKEELVIRKKSVTETRQITEEVTYEQVIVPNNSK